MTSHDPLETSNPNSLSRLRLWLLVGAVGSAAFTLYAGRNSPPSLMILFTFWVLSPFALLVVFAVRSPRWMPQTRAALKGIVPLLSIASIIIYGFFAVTSPKPATPVFVLVPPATWLVSGIVLAAAAFRGRR